MTENDHEIALSLQTLFDQENTELSVNNLVQDESCPITAPTWELIDPNPNIHMLFVEFDEKYFWNTLQSVYVSWSNRMTSCAGSCSYNKASGQCHITLSLPLLKFRPRKDLVETLLHEMIHAYLFILNSYLDRDGHGPEFCKHMDRINAIAGTNITVYHDFHDEVKLYQQHWWKCNGPCQYQRPYFGMVRRAINRAPGPNEKWWVRHQNICSGTFIKVKEPEKPQKMEQIDKKSQETRNKSNKLVSPNLDIRKFYPSQQVNNPSNVNSNVVDFKNSNSNTGNSKSNVAITVPKTKDKKDTNLNNSDIRKFYPLLVNSPSNLNSNIKNTNLGNVSKNSNSTVVMTVPKTERKEDTDLNNFVQPKPSPTCAFPGKGQVLVKKDIDDSHDYELIRNHWINKYPSTSQIVPSIRRPPIDDNFNCDKNCKKLKCDNDNDKNYVKCPVCATKVPDREINEHLDECLFNQYKRSPSYGKPESIDYQTIGIDEEFCDNREHKKDVEASKTVSCCTYDKTINKNCLNEYLDKSVGDDIIIIDDDSN